MNMMKGVIPAMVTPFDEREEVDVNRIHEVVDFLNNTGIHGLYLTGSTGEGFVMRGDERKQVVEAVAESTQVPFIVHVGSIGTKISIDLARHAELSGAAAISSVPPFYWKFKEDNIIRYYTELAESVNIPLIIYNIALAGDIGYETIRKLAQIPNVQGIKYTMHTQFELMRMREDFGDDFAIYSGSDEMAMSGLSYGADGIIGTFYNVLPDLFLDIYQATKAQDLKTMQEKQSLANSIILTALKHDMIPTVKLMMQWMGVDAGYARSPFTRYSDAEAAVIRKEFEEITLRPGAEEVAFLREIRS